MLIMYGFLQERLLALEEYHDLAIKLRSWTTESTTEMLQRHFPSNLTDLKVLNYTLKRIERNKGFKFKMRIDC